MNLMQYLSVSGALESPRERKNSRRIGYNDSDSFNSKPISLSEVSRVNNNQGEFGFIEPLEIDRHSQSPGNHLGLSKEESKAQSIDQMEIQSRITPTRLSVVRNDLVASDIAFRSSLISEEPQRTSFFNRLRNRFSMLDKVIRLVGISTSDTSNVRSVASVSDSPEQMDSLRDDEFQNAIELAKSYKTDVFVNGKVAWSYSDYEDKIKA